METLWENVGVRQSANGHWFLLQKRTHKDGRVEFCNRSIDKLPRFTSILGWELFHGKQILPNNF